MQKENEEENAAYKEIQGDTLNTPEKSPKRNFQFNYEEDTQECYKDDSPPKIVADSIKHDEDSESTFELPLEFIADHNSEESLQTESPKLKTVDIQKNSSLEISENDEIVNIDVVKMQHSDNTDAFNNLSLSPVKTEKCAFKFSPIDKETLQQNNLDIDFQSFKNQYLNEVDRDFAHKDLQEEHKPATQSAIKARMKKQRRNRLKRKKHQGGVVNKKKKLTLVYEDSSKKNIKVICENKDKTLDFTMKTPKTKKKHKKNRGNIQVKIRWREERLKLKITQRKKVKKVIQDSMKQYILDCPQEKLKGLNIVKPDHDVSPKKRKYVKIEKPADKLVQTSLHSFFSTTKPVNNT